MNDKVRVRPHLGCAPVPFATGRVPPKLPVISGLSSPTGKEPGNIRVWFPSKDSSKMTPVSTNGLLSVDSRRFSLDQLRFSPMQLKKSNTFLTGQLVKSHHLKSAISVDVSLGDLETVKRLSAVPQGGLWLRTDKNRLRARAKSADNVQSDSWSTRSDSGKSPVSDSDSNSHGLCRYTPLPAIGCLNRDDSRDEDDLMDITRPVADCQLRGFGSNLDNVLYSNSDSDNSLEKPKLPPLRPIVRSRTFTIISATTNGNDQDISKGNDQEELDDTSNWEDERSESGMSDDEMDDDEEDDSNAQLDDVSDKGGRTVGVEGGTAEDRDTLLCLSIHLPNGDEHQKYFDVEDTLETVLNFALHRYNETTLTEVEELPRFQLVTDDNHAPRVFTDFAKTLCELEISNRTRLYLQQVEREEPDDS